MRGREWVNEWVSAYEFASNTGTVIDTAVAAQIRKGQPLRWEAAFSVLVLKR